MIKNLLDKSSLNIDILVLNKQQYNAMGEVTSHTKFETGTKIFHPKGLFSTEIFGPVGSRARTERYGYIDLRLPILHPFVYENIGRLGKKYLDIMEGTRYVIFDEKLKDFVPSDINNGRTGYQFFLEYVNKINFKETSSDQRSYRIEFVKKYTKPEYLIDKWLVIPAGLRDYTEDERGNPSEDEINNLYNNLLSAASSLRNINVSNNLELFDRTRLRIQKATCAIFSHIFELINGKTKFTEGKFAKRAITYGTRNVITPIPAKIQSLKDNNIIDINKSVIGLYQYVKSIAPIAAHKVLTMFINNVLNPDSNSAYLVNPKTMKTEQVNINPKRRNEWLSIDGINKNMNRLANKDSRFNPVLIDSYFLYAVVDNGSQIVIYEDTSEIPEDTNPKFIRPITYCELFYLAIYDIKDKYPGFATRYPVTGLGSIYPTFPYVKTTSKSRTVNVRYKTWIRDVIEYPVLGELFIESFSPSTQHLARLSGDYDGDVLSYTSLLTEESIAEVKKFLESKEAYITTTNEITYSSSDDVVDIVMKVLTE